MSETPMKAIIEVGSNSIRYVPLTLEEIQQRELDAIAHATAQAEREAEEQRLADLKAAARHKLTTGEPLTAEEAAVVTI